MREFGEFLVSRLYTPIGHAYSTPLLAALGGRPQHWATSHPTTPIVRGSPQVVYPQATWGRCHFGHDHCRTLAR